MKKILYFSFYIIFTPIIINSLEIEPTIFDEFSKQELTDHIKTVYDAKEANRDYAAPQKIDEKIDAMINRLINQARYFMGKNKQHTTAAAKKQTFTNEGSSINYAGYLFASLDKFSQNALHQISKKPLEYDLNWCTCPNFTPKERIFFIVQLIMQIEKNYPNKQSELVYTSLASGGLLQDYLTITELIRAGYTNIRVNIIDLAYPDLAQIPVSHKKRSEKLEELKNTGQEKSDLAEMIETTLRIENFPLHIAAFLSANKMYNNVKILIQEFKDEQDYIARCETKTELKSNVLVMVDPDRPALFKFKSVREPHSKAAKKIGLDGSITYTPEPTTTILNVAPQLLLTNILQLKDDKNNDIYVILSPYQKVHVYSKNQLDAATQNRLNIFKGKLYGSEYIHHVARVVQWLQDPTESLPFELVATYASAHLAFQDVAIKGTKPDAIAYLAADVQVDVNDGKRIKKIDISRLRSIDFIEETIGKDIKSYSSLNCRFLTILS